MSALDGRIAKIQQRVVEIERALLLAERQYDTAMRRGSHGLARGYAQTVASRRLALINANDLLRDLRAKRAELGA